MDTTRRTSLSQPPVDGGQNVTDTRPDWIVPEIEIIDVRETRAIGLGSGDGAASHT